MKSTTWKVLAIIFFSLFMIETIFWLWMVKITINEENKILDCYYEICGDYPDASYENKICTCYDYDVIGDLIPSKYEVMG